MSPHKISFLKNSKRAYGILYYLEEGCVCFAEAEGGASLFGVQLVEDVVEKRDVVVIYNVEAPINKSRKLNILNLEIMDLVHKIMLNYQALQILLRIFKIWSAFSIKLAIPNLLILSGCPNFLQIESRTSLNSSWVEFAFH